MLKTLHTWWIALLFCSQALGQSQLADTVINLDGVTVTASRESVYAIGQPVEKIDSLDRLLMPSGTLADLVTGMTSLYVKNYGSGTLATVSLRGTSANHTGLVWNGIHISPPNIGYLDLSMIRGDFFDGIKVRYGGASPMYGSGFIGGTIHLEDTPDFSAQFTNAGFGVTYGSFGQVDARGRVTNSTKKMYSRTAAFWKHSENNFPYEDLYGDPQKLQHSGMTGCGAIQDFTFRLKGDQSLSALAWFQYSDRDIPPTLTETVSEANQVDRSIRVMAAWKDVNARNILEAKVAYFNEFTRYSDPRFDVYSVIATQTALAQLESSWTLFKITRLFAGTSLTYNNGDLSAYDGTRQECNWALFASLMQPAPSIGWEFVLHMRQEFQSSFTSPFTFGISAQGPVAGPMSMQFSFSRNFRSPTMNERYWQPGGNPGLNPELSWNGDLSIVFNQPTETARFEARMTIFSSLVDNWIMWVPGEILWTVENVLKVWARGIEVTARQETYVSGFQLVFDESYSYTRSTNEKQLDGNDDSYKKQLIYVPVHQAMLRTFLGWKGFGLAIKNTISGKTYTTRDNESSLPAYLLMDVAISKKFKVAGKCTMDLSLVGNNLLNKEYQVTPFRPMPGINFLVSLNVELNHQNKQSK